MRSTLTVHFTPHSTIYGESERKRTFMTLVFHFYSSGEDGFNDCTEQSSGFSQHRESGHHRQKSMESETSYVQLLWLMLMCCMLIWLL